MSDPTDLTDLTPTQLTPTQLTDPAGTPTRSPNRRGFLAGAGAGALGLAAAATIANSAPAAAASPQNDGESSDAELTSSGSLVAFVRDVSRGEISLLSGDHEVVIHDLALAKTLARKAR